MTMDIRKIDNSDLPLFWYVSKVFTQETCSSKVLTDYQDQINKAIKSFEDKKATLENCETLKQFLTHKLAEITYNGHTGAFIDELVEKVNNIIATLDTGIALGQKEQMYHSGGSQAYRNYDWYNEQHNWDPKTMEGYLKSHYMEFSVPTYTLSEFLKSGYFKHCLMHNWDARETAHTFCILYQKTAM